MRALDAKQGEMLQIRQLTTLGFQSGVLQPEESVIVIGSISA